MRKVKLRVCHLPKIISCYKIDLDLSPTLLNASTTSQCLKMFKTQKLIVVVAVETITHIELFLALWARPTLSTSHVQANNDHKVGSRSTLYSGLGGYDKISQVLLLKKSDDKLKLTKVVKFLRVYGYFMGFLPPPYCQYLAQCPTYSRGSNEYL